jgi:asparagine synthase (glutamine-hydrolysing)
MDRGMCGICGAVQIGAPARRVLAPEVLDRMTDAMTHRGPNDRGVFQRDGIALGVRRLSIVDVEGGHQPVCNEDGTIWAVQNGELYNHQALRDELGNGHRYASRCDTEIIPHVYERYGDAYQEHLRGKFGIAVWDERRRRLVLSRDRLGVKPLYYAQSGDLLVFASELKSLLASGCVEPSIDYAAVDAYLTLGYFPAPWTPLEGVFKLLPGHRLIADAHGVRSEPYWRFPRPAPRHGLSDAEQAQGLIAELEEAVRLRLMSDVPLGAMLSGGLDSSLIVALMARNMRDPVKTFSVGFVEDGNGNELADARLVARTFGCEHHELELSVADSTIDLAELSWYADEPLADLSALGLLALSELAARHVTVALAGQGADELLGGYRKHRAAAIVSSWRRLPGPLRAVGERALPARGRLRRPARALRAQGAVERLLSMSGKLDDGDRARLYRGPMRGMRGEAARAAADRCLDGLADEPLAATLFMDAQLALVDDMLHYFDRTSMARSLEVRVPFLDHRVVEYCAGIPERLKVRRRQGKAILREAARGLLPDSVIDKRKVGFFHDSTAEWLRAQSAGAVGEVLLESDLRIGPFLDQGAVRALVTRHAEGIDTSRDELIVALLMLEIWLADTLPRALGKPVSPREQIALSA